MTNIKEKQQSVLKRDINGFYRVAEVNPVYKCEWIFVSNMVEIDEALKIKEEKEKHFPKFQYYIASV